MIVCLAGLAGLFHGLTATNVMALSPEQTVLAPDTLADNFDFVRHGPAGKNLPTLADLLTLEGRASIFYSYARETDMSALFTQSVSEGEGATVFVPTNKAVQALARKPHEDPEDSLVPLTEAEHYATSKENVQRWVGAHIIPSPSVNFTSSEPYDTLTPGTTIAFSAISSKHSPAREPVIDTDAAHLTSLKGKSAVKSCVHSKSSIRRGPEYIQPSVDSDAAHFSSIKGPASPAPEDTAYLSNVKGSSTQTPGWKQYELNDGVHIIFEKKASNGIMYLIDGTVPV